LKLPGERGLVDVFRQPGVASLLDLVEDGFGSVNLRLRLLSDVPGGGLLGLLDDFVSRSLTEAVLDRQAEDIGGCAEGRLDEPAGGLVGGVFGVAPFWVWVGV